jgi:transposase-like protein
MRCGAADRVQETNGVSVRSSIRIRGELHYLWRATDQDGDVLDILAQSRCDGEAAKIGVTSSRPLSEED